MKPTIFTITGPSAGGKSTLERGLIQCFGPAGKVVTFTTRPPRPGETNGVDYFFFNTAKLNQAERNLELLWRKKPHESEGTEYAASAEEFYRALDETEANVAFAAITPDKHEVVRDRFMPEGIRVISIHLVSPGEAILRPRLKVRGLDEKSIANRLGDSVEMEKEAATLPSWLHRLMPASPGGILQQVLGHYHCPT